MWIGVVRDEKDFSWYWVSKEDGYMYPYKKKREGNRLHDIFGEDWDHYDRSVPDYFPKLTRYEKAQDRPWSWKATCDNSEQWGPFAMAVGVCAVIWNQWIINTVQNLVQKVMS